MGGFNTGGDDEVISDINVTPLVDVTLVLLIVFMVTTSYIVKAQINVDLPKAATGQSEVQTTLTFQITEEGQYYLDGDATTLESIAGTVRGKVDAEPQLRAVIAADKGVEYGRVVDLIDTIKSNGLDKFALNIEKKAKPSSSQTESP